MASGRDPMNEVPIRWRRLLLLALGLSYLLMLVSFLPLLLQYQYLFRGDKVLASVADVPLMGTKLGREIFSFVVAQLVIYALYGAIVWLMARAAWYGLRPAKTSPQMLILAWFLLLTVAVLVTNAYLFPWSALGETFWEVLSVAIADVSIASIVLTGAGVVVVATLAATAMRYLREHPRRSPVLIGSLAAMGAGIGILAFAGESVGTRTPARTAPNIILIGVDSLRPDFTVLGGDETHAPNINAFVRKARAFGDVTTPVARTFPSWMSILSGRHPHDTGAIMNLTNRGDISVSPTLPEILKANGYQTVFAIDETRFANIDESYGFDRIVTPPMGAADFLLGSLNDTPLTNLVVDTPIGALVFPHSYANRAAAHVYDPRYFDRRLRSELDFSRPTFLAVHFTLPHYPYHWADAPKYRPTGQPHHGQTLYGDTVTRADAQVGELLQFLDHTGALDNAIVVVLSDHGEALGRESDSLVTDATGRIGDYVIPAARTGHGTSVLSPAQYQVLLAMRGYGPNALAAAPHEVLSQPASLEDLAPTLLDLSGIDRSAYRFGGQSLADAALARAPSTSAAPRIRFTETEFNPPALLAGFNLESEVARQSAKYYQVDPDSGRLGLRESMRQQVMAERQYAAFDDANVLAAIPTHDGYAHVVVAKDRSSARLLDGAPDPSSEPSVAALWQALHERFPIRSEPRTAQAAADK